MYWLALAVLCKALSSQSKSEGKDRNLRYQSPARECQRVTFSAETADATAIAAAEQ